VKNAQQIFLQLHIRVLPQSDYVSNTNYDLPYLHPLVYIRGTSVAGARGSVVGWGTMLQAGRSRFRVPMRWIFFNLPNHSSRTMTLGSTQLLTEMSTRNLPGGKGPPARNPNNLTAICEPTVWIMWKLHCLTTLWVSMACYRDSFTFY
jgi:hypothetical protein